MPSIKEHVDTLLEASISNGREVSKEQVSAAAKALINDSGLKPDELLPLFEIIPREAVSAEVFQSLIPKFFEAEKQLGRIDASKSLVVSGFRGCNPASGKSFVQIASTALSRVAIKEGISTANEDLFADVLSWSLRVLSQAAAENLAEETAGRANTIIVMTLKKSSFFYFAPIVDALRAVKKHLPATTAAVVDGLLEDVLVQANGAQAFDAFLKKSQADLAKIFASVEVELDVAALQRKVRMVALTKILRDLQQKSNGAAVKISDVATGLGVTTGDAVATETAENTVIDAATAGLVAVQIDRASGTIRVMDTAVLRFDAAAWKDLKKKVDGIIQITDGLAKTYGLAAV
jgi:hypothetical protein